MARQRRAAGQQAIDPDPDPVRATLLLAIADVEQLRRDAIKSREHHERHARDAIEQAHKSLADREALLGALCALKPPFPGADNGQAESEAA